MLRINNTLTRKKEPLKLQKPGEVSLYVCGATVYDDCHIGHARSAIIFDVMRNYLEYKGLSVRYVKNYTDVDDKIINRAAKEKRTWREVADEFIVAYERDMRRLGVKSPTVAPKATDHIPEMIQLIEGLIKKGMAYAVAGDVYFEVNAFEAYGKLSHRNLDDLRAGARVEVDERKKNPLDFALWKNSKPGEPTWESPWGRGRPGWHIECSAMGMKHLGETFDLHGGGEDLVFPHHENEVAQSEAFTGKNFATCWIHHSFVTLDQEKMSKSLGNFFTVDQIFKKSSQFPETVVSEVLRFYLLSTHYRSPIDFSNESLKVAKSGLDNFYVLFQKIDELSVDAVSVAEDPSLEKYQARFEAAMDDDFNTARAIGTLQELRAAANQFLKQGEYKEAILLGKRLRALGKVLGFFRLTANNWRYQSWELALEKPEGRLDDEKIQALISERNLARQSKNWGKSDEIRKKLADAGVIIEDRPDGTTRVKR
ncbi:MAG: cysteine--tRNA ligase [Nitrospirae bacterium]|nr:cysteine--tRNA ligase [Candidatus Manganitrophaceae bacterium]